MVKVLLFFIKLLIYLVVLAVIVFGIYYFLKSGVIKENLGSYRDYFSGKTSLPHVVIPDNWKEHRVKEFDLSFRYPPDWRENPDGRVSQFLLPIQPKEDAVYNVIEVLTHQGVLYSGYYDQDLFQKVSGLNEGERWVMEDTPSYQTVFTKAGSGYTLSNHRFVVFKLSGYVNNSTFNYSEAFVLKGTKIYIFKLSNEDETGFRVFKDIVASTTIN